MRHSLTLVLLVGFFWGCMAPQVVRTEDKKTDETNSSYSEKTTPIKKVESLPYHTYVLEDNSTLYFIDTMFYQYKAIDKPPILKGKFTFKNGVLTLNTKNTTMHFNLNNVDNTASLTPAEDRIVYRPKDIFQAARWGTKEEFKTLLAKNNKSIESENSFGNRPLMEATFSNNTQIIDYLLTKKVDVDASNFSGYTALYYALQTKNKELSQTLLEHNASIENLHCDELAAFVVKLPTILDAIIDAGFEVNCDNATILFDTLDLDISSAKKRQQLEALVNHGVKLDLKSQSMGDTAVMRACAMGDDRVLSFLLEKGADALAKDRFSRTALDYDSIYIQGKNPKIKRLLNDAGLYTSKKIKINTLYDETEGLLENGFAQKAYISFKKLAKKYKQKRFFKGVIQAGLKLEHSSLDQINEIINIYKYLHSKTEKNYVKILVSLYEKALVYSSKDATREKGKFHKKSRYSYYQKIENIYRESAQRFSLGMASKRVKNLHRMGRFSPLVRIDSTNKNGVRYVGESINGIPLGKGVLQYKNGDTYYGDVVNYIRHGKGKYTAKSGLIYDGYFKADKRDGQGLFTDKKNAMFLGEFKNNKLVSAPVKVREGR